MTMKTLPYFNRGSALLEVLITIVILAFGLLGVAALQSRIYVMEFESYQRAQAVVILNDIAERISANTESAAAYTAAATAAAPLGGTSALVSCTSMTDTARDICELGNLLKGSAEKNNGAGVGGMNRAIACITSFTAPSVLSRCQSGVQIDIVWQGRSPTIVPAATCGTAGGSPLYTTTDAFRRAISTRVSTRDMAVGEVIVGVPACI